VSRRSCIACGNVSCWPASTWGAECCWCAGPWKVVPGRCCVWEPPISDTRQHDPTQLSMIRGSTELVPEEFAGVWHSPPQSMPFEILLTFDCTPFSSRLSGPCFSKPRHFVPFFGSSVHCILHSFSSSTKSICASGRAISHSLFSSNRNSALQSESARKRGASDPYWTVIVTGAPGIQATLN